MGGGRLLIGVYAIGKAVGGFTFTAPGTSFDVLGWQLLFTGGLLFGWAWEARRPDPGPVAQADSDRSRRLHRWCPRPRRRSARAAPTTSSPGRHETNGGFVAFMFAASALVTAYVVLDALRRRYTLAARLMKPLEILGLKGLPGTPPWC